MDWDSILIYDINVETLKIKRMDYEMYLSCNITWKINIPQKYEKSIECIDIFCKTNDEFVFAGRCMAVENYYVDTACQEPSNNRFEFYFQVVFLSGVRNDIAKCPKKEIILPN